MDFHKSCIEAQGKMQELFGRPIYYRQCVSCGFVVTDEFDDWSTCSPTKGSYCFQR